MTKIVKHLLLSLLILCITTLAYGKDTKADNAHYANDGSNTGPNASKYQQFLLNKQGGEILPYVSDIQIIDRK